jgi:hypothetical protein
MVEDSRVDFGHRLCNLYGRHRAALVLTYNAAVRRPKMTALQPVVLGLHVEKEMREFR